MGSSGVTLLTPGLPLVQEFGLSASDRITLISLQSQLSKLQALSYKRSADLQAQKLEHAALLSYKNSADLQAQKLEYAALSYKNSADLQAHKLECNELKLELTKRIAATEGELAVEKVCSSKMTEMLTTNSKTVEMLRIHAEEMALTR